MKRRRGTLALAILVLLMAAPLLLNLGREGEVVIAGSDGTCLDCHSNAGRLISLLQAREEPGGEEEGGGCAVAPGRAEFLNYFVNKEFASSTHGQLGCTTCHGGNATTEEMEAAHTDMRDPEAQCADCHGEIVQVHQTSIHWTLAGQDRWLRLRAGSEENFAALEPVRQNDCNKCHASCGDCHVNIPQAVGGGLISGHKFFGTPPMGDTCAVCHGSRAGGEFQGTLSEELPADVHFQAGMTCLDCHKEPMHGDSTSYESRWEVAGLPQCTDCHPALPNSEALAHSPAPHAEVSCQVCHAVAYKNCFRCHAWIDEEGQYHRAPQEKAFMIKIGHNTVPDYPYEYVPVRHNPVARDAFDSFGEGLLPDFDQYPTWKTAAPHNIQRVTPQNGSCDSCHGNEELFLTEDDLDPEDSQANVEVVLEEIP